MFADRCYLPVVGELLDDRPEAIEFGFMHGRVRTARGYRRHMQLKRARLDLDIDVEPVAIHRRVGMSDERVRQELNVGNAICTEMRPCGERAHQPREDRARERYRRDAHRSRGGRLAQLERLSVQTRVIGLK